MLLKKQNSTIELAETLATSTKKAPEGANFKYGGNDEARLGLLAVHNFYTPFLFFLRKTALRQVVHRDVTSPHFVRSSHLPNVNEHLKWLLWAVEMIILENFVYKIFSKSESLN